MLRLEAGHQAGLVGGPIWRMLELLEVFTHCCVIIYIWANLNCNGFCLASGHQAGLGLDERVEVRDRLLNHLLLFTRLIG